MMLSYDSHDGWLGRDKGLHFAAGAAIGLGAYFLGSFVLDGRASRVAVGVSIGLGAGAAKELRDRRSGGTASWRDFTWTAGGTAAGVTAGWLIDRARQRQGGAPAPAVAPGASLAMPAAVTRPRHAAAPLTDYRSGGGGFGPGTWD